MFTGKTDELDDLDDVKWTKKSILAGLSKEEQDKVLVHYQEINGGYATFLVGAKMEYLENMVKLIR